MIRDVDLVSYLPPFIAEFREINAALETENPEFQMVWEAADRVLKNAFIATADEYGISRWERVAGILPYETDTLEDRRFRLFARINEIPPFTLRSLQQRFDALCGEGVCALAVQDYLLTVMTNITEDRKGLHILSEIREMTDRILPANMNALFRSCFRPIVFSEPSGRLIFRRLAVASAFTNYRGNRFNGARRFDGSILFDQDGVGLRFERFTVAALFSHIRGGVSFDGTADFGGGILFNQEYGSTTLSALRIAATLPRVVTRCVVPRVGVTATFPKTDTRYHTTRVRMSAALRAPPIRAVLPCMRVSGALPRPKQRATVSRLCASAAATHHHTATHPRLTVSAGTRHNSTLTGNLTIDNLYTFDGSVSFDGTRRFACITKEEL